MSINTLLILDRDGVINEDSDDYIKSEQEWRPIPGSIEAIAALSAAGFTVAVATNQSGLGRGYFDEAELGRMHAKLLDLVAQHGGAIAAIAFCPHVPDDECDCRKPKPGLVRSIEEQTGLSAAGAWFVGDNVGDIGAARAAGCQPVLVKTGKGERTLAKLAPAELDGVPVFTDLAAFADHAIARLKESHSES
ncbi:D-glycero-beta-D-manno-heptose 1,7-bisphosphate 7-phosphatase [Hahella sp. KA22]|uniref:D-glycero-beta-D-manno-heptose 1,7-bisphosphate 7-phosphatase n=1 Tax=Hahella sp. KA22 TaxID=1628392 RepID=UPI000FDF0BA8|nr:D-glycero-beta-D-manno-heptose 1,7-bisphosphate 7-phosphatase [Hahella sp. KA22]AZZ89664.1 D-glycero-beta-D-manno-heptose 1,7-bisphosphate 7-phosphatase [Hahella sp. KA22]QAY53034.1 D-glycero-beta-D-manno-heptose 1,7-bisphosphate 7-phosphatase [Hahella sp. KA22]